MINITSITYDECQNLPQDPPDHLDTNGPNKKDIDPATHPNLLEDPSDHQDKTEAHTRKDTIPAAHLDRQEDHHPNLDPNHANHDNHTDPQEDIPPEQQDINHPDQ
jgi:hypothetical protein